MKAAVWSLVDFAGYGYFELADGYLADAEGQGGVPGLSVGRSPSDDEVGHKVRGKRSVPLECLARSVHPSADAEGRLCKPLACPKTSLR